MIESPSLITLGGASWGLFTWGVSGGIASFFSPCALPMLPAYVSYYLSTDSEQVQLSRGNDRVSAPRLTSVRRGVTFGVAACAGLLTVFAVTAILTGVLGNVLRPLIPLLLPAVGLIVLTLGGLLLVDRTRLVSITVRLPERAGPSLSQFYVFGALFAGAALGCTAPVFFAVTLTALSTGGMTGAATVIAGYAGGMVIPFIGMTTLLALARERTARRVQALIPLVERASALLLIGVGAYLLYYFVQVIP